MKFSARCKLENIVRNIDGTITYYLKDADKNIQVNKLQELKDKDLRLELDVWREKRSMSANDYSWVLQNEIAKKMNLSIDEVHNKMVLEYGVLETYSILKDAFESAKRLFDYYKILGESEVNGKTFVHIRAGVGTHNYDTKEMSVFIDGVVQEAQALDIDTRTPDQIAELLSLWRENEKQTK